MRTESVSKPSPLEGLLRTWEATGDASKQVQETYRRDCKELLARHQELCPTFLLHIQNESLKRKEEGIKILKSVGWTGKPIAPETLDAFIDLGKQSPQLVPDILRTVVEWRMILEHRAQFTDLLRVHREKTGFRKAEKIEAAETSAV